MRKQILAAGIATIVGAAGIGTGVAHAATSSESDSGPMSSLVDTLASKFNLNKTEVQQVFDEQHDKMEAERTAKQDERLAKLVTDGKLTQAQVDALKAKRDEIQKQRETNRETMKDKTDEERKTAMKSERTALESWAKEQGIDTQYLRFVIGHGGPGGHGGPHSGAPDSTSDNSQ